MESELKRAMKLMWGNKHRRSAFGFGFGFKAAEYGWVVALMVVTGLAPAVAKLFDKTFPDRAMIILLESSAILWDVVLISFSQKMFARYGKLGKYFGSLPMAKYVMTKGYFFSTWILWGGGLLLTSLLYGLCVAVKAAPGKGYYIILIFFGLIFFMDGICCAFRNKNHPENEVYYSTGVSITVVWIVSFARSMAKNTDVGIIKKLKPEKIMVLFVIFMILGNMLLCYFSKKRYKERSTGALELLKEE